LRVRRSTKDYGSVAVLTVRVNVISVFGIDLSEYVDDTQLHISLKDERVLSLLSDCFVAVHLWFTLNGLSLNPDKSETTIIGTGVRQQSKGSLEVIDLGNATVGKCSQSWCRAVF